MLKWLKHSNGDAKDTATSKHPTSPLASVLHRENHGISRQKISDNALKVMYRLNKAGFAAYLVGGGVRDLLLGGEPKDFDVATNATPEEVKHLFSNSRIVGRRFRIVHVRFGREIIEVTTFRGHHGSSDQQSGGISARNEHGMLLRDNVYGTIEEDALRRDFTVNALYYTVEDFSVHDFCNGLEDLNNKIIRIIGDPESRYREDPVRMLRAIRFAAKLEFQLHPDTSEPIIEHGELIRAVPPARLFDEVLKLFMSGYATRTYMLMRTYQLFAQLFPAADRAANQSASVDLFFINALRNTDARISESKPVTPAFIYAALLWPLVKQRCEELCEQKRLATMPALHEAAQQVLFEQCQHTAIPKRLQVPMREIWEMQYRLPNHNGNRAQRLFNHPRFRASYDFLLLREEAGEIEPGLGQWWTDYQLQSPEQRVEKARNGNKRPRRRRSNNRRQKPY